MVAFADDDAVADPTWAGVLRAAFFEDPALAACLGRVTALDAHSPGARLFEANGGFDRGTERIRLPDDHSRRLHGRRAPLIAWAVSIGCGCSLAVRREAALSVGGFDGRFGADTALPGGEDHDLIWRLLAAGHAVAYEPHARVRHEHRENEAAIGAQIASHQRGLLAMLTKALLDARGPMRREILAFVAWRLVKPGIRLLHRALGRDPLPAAILWRMWVHSFAGAWTFVRLHRARGSGR